MDESTQDYLFDLQGYLVLENAISPEDLREMNQWIDDHESYVEEPWTPPMLIPVKEADGSGT